MKILAEQSAGLIIDYQEKLVPHMFERDKAVGNTGLLIQGFKIL